MIVILPDGIILNTKKVAAIQPFKFAESNKEGAEILMDYKHNQSYPETKLYSYCTTEEIYSAILEEKKK